VKNGVAVVNGGGEFDCCALNGFVFHTTKMVVCNVAVVANQMMLRSEKNCY
jgi:hypothetical protein